MPFFIIWLIEHSNMLEITIDHIIRLCDFCRSDGLQFTQMQYRFELTSGQPSTYRKDTWGGILRKHKTYVGPKDI